MMIHGGGAFGSVASSRRDGVRIKSASISRKTFGTATESIDACLLSKAAACVKFSDNRGIKRTYIIPKATRNSKHAMKQVNQAGRATTRDAMRNKNGRTRIPLRLLRDRYCTCVRDSREDCWWTLFEY